MLLGHFGCLAKPGATLISIVLLPLEPQVWVLWKVTAFTGTPSSLQQMQVLDSTAQRLHLAKGWYTRCHRDVWQSSQRSHCCPGCSQGYATCLCKVSVHACTKRGKC